MAEQIDQIELRVRAPVLRNREALETALDQAATQTYRDLPLGGPCVAGDLVTGEISVLVSVNPEQPLSWFATTLPLLEALAAAVPGPVFSVHAAPLSESTTAE